jgi:hypothetical protein
LLKPKVKTEVGSSMDGIMNLLAAILEALNKWLGFKKSKDSKPPKHEPLL